MGWTIQYRAHSPQGNIDEFVAEANRSKLGLMWGSERYFWEAKDSGSAGGFTKIQSSLMPKRDFKKIVLELQVLAERWSGVRIDACDDFVLGDWWHVKNIKVEELEL